MPAMVSVSNRRPPASYRCWLESATVCALSPMLRTRTVTRTNCPCACLPTYWSPTLAAPALTPVTVNSNLPSRTGGPIFAAACAGALVVGAAVGLVAVGDGVAGADVAAGAAVVVVLLPPPLTALAMMITARTPRTIMRTGLRYQGRLCLPPVGSLISLILISIRRGLGAAF